jgi:hypothetical protein
MIDEKHPNDVESAGTATYQAKTFSATKHSASVILNDDGIGGTNVLWVSDGKAMHQHRLSGLALDCLYEVLRRRHQETWLPEKRKRDDRSRDKRETRETLCRRPGNG